MRLTSIMRPFQLLRNRRHESDKGHTVASSIVSPQKWKNQNIYDDSRGFRKGFAPSVASTQHRSRSVDRRIDHHANSVRESSRSEKRQGYESRWLDRLGGSVVSVGKRPKSVDASSRRSASRSRVKSQRRRSRSRSRGRSRSRSRGRSSKGNTDSSVHSSSRRSRHDEQRRTPPHDQVLSIRSKRSKSLEPVLKRPSEKWTLSQSSITPTSLPNEPETQADFRRIPPLKSAIMKPPTPPTSSKANRKRQPVFPVIQPINPLPKTKIQGKPQPSPLVPGKTTSAFQRWPRLPNFRPKKLGDEKDEFSLDQSQRQRLLTMILGNNGSIFDEGSTLNAPNGEVMRTDPRDRINADNTPTKNCGEHVVEAALMFEAISASPFICIQTICCVQDDYMEAERNNLNTTGRGGQGKKLSTLTRNGLPVVIKVEGSKIAPKTVDVPKDEPSVSVFTNLTFGSKEGFWLPFGLGYCGDSVVHERDDRSTPELSRHPMPRDETPDTLENIGEKVNENISHVDTTVEQLLRTSPDSANVEKADESILEPPSSKVSEEPTESPVNQLDDPSRDETPITSNSSVSNNSTSEDAYDACRQEMEHKEALTWSNSPIADEISNDEDPRKKLEEWEEMEAKLKWIFKLKEGDIDDCTIRSM